MGDVRDETIGGGVRPLLSFDPTTVKVAEPRTAVGCLRLLVIWWGFIFWVVGVLCLWASGLVLAFHFFGHTVGGALWGGLTVFVLFSLFLTFLYFNDTRT